MQMKGECFGIAACGFQAGVNPDDALLGEPGVELPEAFGIIGKLLVSEFVVA